MARAEQLGREQEGDDSGSFTWGGRPSTWVFAGVRKLMACSTPGTELQDGVEITFNELVFASLDDVQSFVEEEPVQADFVGAAVEEVPAACASGA